MWLAGWLALNNKFGNKRHKMIPNGMFPFFLFHSFIKFSLSFALDLLFCLPFVVVLVVVVSESLFTSIPSRYRIKYSLWIYSVLCLQIILISLKNILSVCFASFLSNSILFKFLFFTYIDRSTYISLCFIFHLNGFIQIIWN